MSKKSKKSESKWQKIAEESAEQEKHEKTEGQAEQGKAAEPQSAGEAEPAGIEFPSRHKLEDQLTAMEMKVDEYKNLYVRAQAEIENLERRTEQRVNNAHKYGNEKLLVELIPIIDSLHRALEGEECDDPHVKSMRQGLELTLDMLLKTLNKFGVNLIDPAVGDAFDPQLHEAMTMQKDPKAKSNTVLQVMQIGYQLNGRVLRAAMVIVAQ